MGGLVGDHHPPPEVAELPVRVRVDHDPVGGGVRRRAADRQGDCGYPLVRVRGDVHPAGELLDGERQFEQQPAGLPGAPDRFDDRHRALGEGGQVGQFGVLAEPQHQAVRRVRGPDGAQVPGRGGAGGHLPDHPPAGPVADEFDLPLQQRRVVVHAGDPVAELGADGQPVHARRGLGEGGRPQRVLGEPDRGGAGQQVPVGLLGARGRRHQAGVAPQDRLRALRQRPGDGLPAAGRHAGAGRGGGRAGRLGGPDPGQRELGGAPGGGQQGGPPGQRRTGPPRGLRQVGDQGLVLVQTRTTELTGIALTLS